MSRWAFYGSEASINVAPEHLSRLRKFSLPSKIPTGSSKLASSATSSFSTVRRFPRVGFSVPRRFVRLLFRSRKPKSHYKRSFWEDIWPGRPQLRLLLGRLPVVISLMTISCRARSVLLFFQNFENRASGTCSRCMIIVLSCFSSFKRILQIIPECLPQQHFSQISWKILPICCLLVGCRNLPGRRGRPEQPLTG